MSQPYSSREDLKSDVLQEGFKTSLEWAANHRQTFFSIVGTLAAALLVFAFVYANFKTLRKQSWERFAAGQTLMMQNNFDASLNYLNDVTANYSRTPAACYALLLKGDIYIRQGKFSDAVAAYQQCLDKAPPKVILPFVLSSLGAAQEDNGDFNGAISSYKRFISEFPDHYLAPKIYESLGRAYELAANLDAAKEIYEKIITMFPASIWSDKARERYQVLSPQPFQNSPSQTSAFQGGK